MRGNLMDIDVINLRSNKGQGRVPDPRKCYRCGKPGHIARNCRGGNTMRREQINVINELPDEYEWVGHNSEEYDSPDDHQPEDTEPGVRRRIPDYYENDSSDNSQDLRAVYAWARRAVETPSDEGKDPEHEGEEDSVTVDHNDAQERSPPPTPQTPGSPIQSPTPYPGLQQPVTLSNRSQHEGLTDDQRGYPTWPFNFLHDTIDWSLCHQDGCVRHEQQKRQHQFRPRETRFVRCFVEDWKDCEDDGCSAHLVDKRHALQFPGHDLSWHACLKKYQTRWTGSCAQLNGPKFMGRDWRKEWTESWYYCTRDDCQGHRQEKILYGFLPTEEINHIHRTRPSWYAPINLHHAYWQLPLEGPQRGRPWGTAPCDYFHLDLSHQGKTVLALLDTGAKRNYISRRAAETLDIPIRMKRKPYRVSNCTGLTIPDINYETMPREISIQ